MPAFFLNRPEGKIGITSGKNQFSYTPDFSPGFVSELILSRFLTRPEWLGF